MVKVKRVIHLEDKNIVEDDAAALAAPAPVVKEESNIKEEDALEERRSTRKIKKKRHKYGEDEEEEGEFGEDFGEVEEASRSATPVRGMRPAKRLPAATPSSIKKKPDSSTLDGNESSMDTPPGKRPRLVRGAAAKSTDSTPVKEETFVMEGVSPLHDLPFETTGSGVESESEIPKEEIPVVPKETVTFRAGASNPAGLQTLIEFLIRVLRRKDVNGFFSHPPTETLCPGYFSRIEVPMDFDLIQQKFDAGLYVDLPTFRGDAMLLFDNALKYFDGATVVYHAARKMRQFVRKITGKDKLLGMKLSFPSLLAGIGIEELGLDEAEMTKDETGSAAAARDDEGNLVAEVEVDVELDLDEDLKVEWAKMEREDKSKHQHHKTKQKVTAAATSTAATTVAKKPLKDTATSQEVLTSWISAVGNAGRKTSTPISTNRQNPVITRQDAAGLTTLSILNPDNAAVHTDANGDGLFRPPHVEANAAVSMKQTLSRVPASGSGVVSGFKEDRRNILKPVKYVDQTAFCSFGPSYDSRFANISKADSDQLVSSFHAESDLTFVDDIKSAIGESSRDSYELDAVDNLLDALTGGDYSKRNDVMAERKKLKEAEEKMKQIVASSPSSSKPSVVVGETSTRRVGGGNVSTVRGDDNLDKLLEIGAAKIRSLEEVQMTRLSTALPQHLGMVKAPSKEEVGMAEEVTDALTTMAKRATPSDLVSQRALFRALGIDLDKYSSSASGDTEAAAAMPTAMLSAPGVSGVFLMPNRLEAPSTPMAKIDVPQNIFQRTFNAGFSFSHS